MTEQQQAEAAARVLNELLDRREALIAVAARYDVERRAIAFAACTGDAAAVTKLKDLNDATVLNHCERETVEVAVQEASDRLQAARQQVSQAAEREKAYELREKLKQFVEQGEQVDDALWDLLQSLTTMIRLLNEMRQLGHQSAPTAEQFRICTVMSIKSMLQELPQVWTRDFEFQRLSPSQKKKFGDLIPGWQAQVEKTIAAKLGEDAPENNPRTPEVAA
jgi:hypothetical protein